MERKTLRDHILDGDDGLKGSVYIDRAAHATYRSFATVVRGKRSPAFGSPYEILDIKDRASFNPNHLVTTMVVRYLSNPQETVDLYLHEQFDDVLANDDEIKRAILTAATIQPEESISRMLSE